MLVIEREENFDLNEWAPPRVVEKKPVVKEEGIMQWFQWCIGECF